MIEITLTRKSKIWFVLEKFKSN